MLYPVEMSQPLSLVTFVLALWGYEHSSHGGGGRGCAWAQGHGHHHKVDPPTVTAECQTCQQLRLIWNHIPGDQQASNSGLIALELFHPGGTWVAQ